MRCASIILGLTVTLVGCGKKEEAASAPVAAPAKVSIESANEAPPPAPVPASGGAAEAVSPPPEEKRDPNMVAKSVYDDVSPEQQKAAAKFRRNRDWMVIFKSGSDAQKQQAKKAIDALPPAERAEFEDMTRMYGIKYP